MFSSSISSDDRFARGFCGVFLAAAPFHRTIRIRAICFVPLMSVLEQSESRDLTRLFYLQQKFGVWKSVSFINLLSFLLHHFLL